MSRFLKTRHYMLVLPGIRFMALKEPKKDLYSIIQDYLDQTKVSFTQDDIEEIKSLYYKNYNEY